MKNSSTAIRFRLQQILAYIQAARYASVQDLAEHFDVSRVTIRKDLDLLAQQGKIIRTFGGAEYPEVSFSSSRGSDPLQEHSLLPHDTELFLGKGASIAASLIRDGDVVFLNNSVFSSRVTECISGRNVTVITNRLDCLFSKRRPDVSLLLTGGMVKKDAPALVGTLTQSSIMTYQADTCILGCTEQDFPENYSESEAETLYFNHQMIEQTSGKTIVFLGSSLVGDSLRSLLPDLERVSDLITSPDADPGCLAKLREIGIHIHLTERQSNENN